MFKGYFSFTLCSSVGERVNFLFPFCAGSGDFSALSLRSAHEYWMKAFFAPRDRSSGS